ncbi:hypothetical protein A0H81_07581 [Grifola frondosa]|uniref:Uncharacterized protein n=1 Tax=Grifola frondosa TaxID=5627 RepID=A0A1C7MBU7_GRIFR|nr:hypothetical protein A0H81_07581 [Grifola frondosa]
MAPNTIPTAVPGIRPQSAGQASICRPLVVCVINRHGQRCASNSVDSDTAGERSLPATFVMEQQVFVKTGTNMWAMGTIVKLLNLCQWRYSGVAYEVKYTTSDGQTQIACFLPHDIRPAIQA